MVNEILKGLPKEWTTYNLGSCAQILRGGSPRPIQDYLTTNDQGVNWIKIGDVSSEAKYITYTEEKIIPEGVTKSRRVYKGDLILSNSMSFGRPYILNIDGCIHDGWLVIQKFKKTFDKDFLYYALSSEQTIQQYTRMAAGSSVQNLNKEKVSNIVLPCPTLSEQKRIAEALSDIDSLIFDQKELIKKYNYIKCGCLQKMFPCLGENVPEMRFPEFTDSWEQRKFSDIAERLKVTCLSSKSLPSVEYEDVVSEQGTLNKDLSEKEIAKVGIKFSSGDVLFGKLRPYLKNWLLPNFEGVAVGDWWVLRPILISNEFLYHLIQTNQFLSVANVSSGSKMPRSDWKLIAQTYFSVPLDRQEQTRIGQLFQSLDSNITLHQRKLEKYKNIKRGMLEDLLTGKIRLL